jgi:hypothetical protein
MGDDKIEIIEAEKVEVPQVSSSLQALNLIYQGFAYFFENHPKKTIAFLLTIVALALILYLNINVYREVLNVVDKVQAPQ